MSKEKTLITMGLIGILCALSLVVGYGAGNKHGYADGAFHAAIDCHIAMNKLARTLSTPVYSFEPKEIKPKK